MIYKIVKIGYNYYGDVEMMEKVISLIKNGNINIPRLLLLNYKELNLKDNEFILIIYLLNEIDVFNPKKISDDMKMSMPEVLELVSSLEEKGFLSISVRKVNNIREDYIDFKNLYSKLSFLIINENVVITEEKKENLFDCFEKEFARTLSPVEYELINGWKEIGYSEEIIILALKEAVFNGVSNLRYIDKILYDWKKKGLTTKEDVEKNKREFKSKKVEKKELIDYDWLNDNDE